MGLDQVRCWTKSGSNRAWIKSNLRKRFCPIMPVALTAGCHKRPVNSRIPL